MLATLASFSNGYCKTLSGNKAFSLFETCISYISIASINVELEVKVKLLRFGKSIALSFIDIKNIKSMITFFISNKNESFPHQLDLKVMVTMYMKYMVGWKCASTINSLVSMNVCGVSKHGSN